MAPEQAIGDTKAIAEPVDIYALGAILYELLTGRPPFRERTVIETLQKVIEGSPIEPHKINPRVDRGPDAICMKCLAKAKSERYATASELADDLDRFLNGDRPSAQKGAATVWIDAVVRESPYTEIMRLWSGIWMWLACNAFVIAILQGLLLWYAVDDFLPYILLWVFKVVGDVAAAWLLRIRNGPPPLPVERQLMLIWAFFWVSHILMTWFYMRTGASAAAFMPIIDVELAVVLGSMAAILGGSFYIAAALCIVKAILEAYWPGAGCLFAATVVCPYFFVLGWRHRRADVES
jgi:serine/threonine-protein kinase